MASPRLSTRGRWEPVHGGWEACGLGGCWRAGPGRAWGEDGDLCAHAAQAGVGKCVLVHADTRAWGGEGAPEPECSGLGSQAVRGMSGVPVDQGRMGSPGGRPSFVSPPCGFRPGPCLPGPESTAAASAQQRE